jgi:hypothetical protein
MVPICYVRWPSRSSQCSGCALTLPFPQAAAAAHVVAASAKQCRCLRDVSVARVFDSDRYREEFIHHEQKPLFLS